MHTLGAAPGNDIDEAIPYFRSEGRSEFSLLRSHPHSIFIGKSSWEMPNPYSNVQWIEFRNEMIELDGGVCKRCGRGIGDGVVLQVHHKAYRKGALPWEYSYSDCETLCKGCHGQEHGKVRPSFGWELLGTDDLGELSGVCEFCSTEIRYVFLFSIPTGSPRQSVHIAVTT